MASADDISPAGPPEPPAPDERLPGGRQLFEISRDGLLVLDADGVVASANPAAGRLAGEPPERLAGRAAESLFQPRYRAAFAALLPPPEERMRRAPAHLVLAGSQAVPVEASVTEVDGGEAPRLLVSLRDLREQAQVAVERRRLDRELGRLQRLQSLARTAGALGHEINNVLALVSTVSSLAREIWAGHGSAGDFKEILDAAQRGRELTRQLLGFAGPSPARRDRQEPDRLVHQAAALVRRLGSGLLLIVEDLDARDARVMGDASQIYQAVLSLGMNALDAVGPTGGRIVFRTRRVELSAEDLPFHERAGPGRYVRVEVEDDGPGFSPEALDHAFEPFFPAKPGLEGGLGLATVWRTAQDHGGFVTIDPRRGSGARVVLHLREADGAALEIPAPAPAPRPPRAGATALIVDDEAPLRAAFERLFEKLGYRVLTASAGPAAVAVVRDRPGRLAVVLLDLSMPGMDGIGVARLMREIDPQLPILLMSGYSREGVPGSILQQPATEFISKPFAMDQLRQAVERLARDTAAAGAPP